MTDVATMAMVETTTITPAARLLRNILDSGRVVDDRGQSMELHSHLPAEAGRMLQRIIRDLDAVTTLEIGMAFGVGRSNSVNDAVVGSKRPIFEVPLSQNHRQPSKPSMAI